MIEISHRQARWLEKRQLDISLSAEEWNALQAHYERCSDCRKFQRNIQSTERNLRQSLEARWGPVSGPASGLPQLIFRHNHEREHQRRNLAITGTWIAIFFLIALIAAGQEQSQKAKSMIPLTGKIKTTLAPTGIPTQLTNAVPVIQPGQFPHIVAYQSNIEGNEEIYLLNPGFEPVNLTLHPADDSFPAWSPDGEWIAFLSNRATLSSEQPKNEIYISSIAGNRFLQLTSESLVDWIGPLSWSADGKWIAAAGISTDSPRLRSIFLVAVDGTGIRQLRDTQGGISPKIAPYGDRLAFYQADNQPNRIVIYHIDSGKSSFVDLPAFTNLQDLTKVSFDWPGDGDGLYYSPGSPTESHSQPTKSGSGGQVCSMLFIQPKDIKEPWYEKLRDHFHLAVWDQVGEVQNVSWAANGLLVYLVDNQNTDLCIQSNLDRGAWSLDMRWLVFSGWEPGTTGTGLYAIRMAGLNLAWQPIGATGARGGKIPVGAIFRLSTNRIETNLPRVRPFRENLKIEPRPGKYETIRSIDFAGTEPSRYYRQPIEND